MMPHGWMVWRRTDHVSQTSVVYPPTGSRLTRRRWVPCLHPSKEYGTIYLCLQNTRWCLFNDYKGWKIMNSETAVCPEPQDSQGNAGLRLFSLQTGNSRRETSSMIYCHFFVIRRLQLSVWWSKACTVSFAATYIALFTWSAEGASVPSLIHRVSKNVPPSTCYNLDIHNPITIIFDRSVTEKVRNQTMFCFPTSPI